MRKTKTNKLISLAIILSILLSLFAGTTLNPTPKTALAEDVAIVKHSISFNTQGGNVINPVLTTGNFVLTTLPVPAKENCQFMGWFEEDGCMTEVSLDKIYSEDTTIYAKWQTNEEFKQSTSLEPTLAGYCGAFGNYAGLTWQLVENDDVLYAHTFRWMSSGKEVETVFYSYSKDNAYRVNYYGAWNGTTFYTQLLPEDINRGNYIISVIEENSVKVSKLKTYSLKLSGTGNMNVKPWESVLKTLGSSVGNITQIELSEGITSLIYRAFSGAKIKNIDLPDSLKSIGGDALSGCSLLESIVIPSSVESFAGGVFWGDCSLKSVIFEEGDEHEFAIDNALNQNHPLEELILSNNITYLGGQFLFYCQAIKELNIPASVNSMVVHDLLAPLEKLTVDEENEVFGAYDNVLYKKDEDGNLTTMQVIPNGVKSIELPLTMTSLYGESSYYCNSINHGYKLEEVTIADGDSNSPVYQNFKAVDGVLYNNDLTKIVIIPKEIGYVKLPDTLLGFESTFLNPKDKRFLSVEGAELSNMRAGSMIATDSYKSELNRFGKAIKVVLDGGEFVGEYEEGVLPELKKEGHIFCGWYEDADFNTIVLNPQVEKNASGNYVTYFAKFLPIEYADALTKVENVQIEQSMHQSDFRKAIDDEEFADILSEYIVNIYTERELSSEVELNVACVETTAVSAETSSLNDGEDGRYAITINLSQTKDKRLYEKTLANFNMTVVATPYEANSIIYDLNGGIGTENQEVQKGAKTVESSDPTRTGYVFEKWVNADNEEFIFGNTLDEDITIYAVWTPVTYTIEYDSNEVEVSNIIEDMTATYDIEYNLENGFESVQKTFKGWSTTSDGAVEYGVGGVISNLGNLQDDVVTLYAIWGDRVVTSIEMTSSPKLVYAINDTISIDGMVIKATYDNGSVNESFESFTLSDVDTSTSGTKAVTVTATDTTIKTTFNVTIIELESIYEGVVAEIMSTAKSESEKIELKYILSDASVAESNEGSATTAVEGVDVKISGGGITNILVSNGVLKRSIDTAENEKAVKGYGDYDVVDYEQYTIKVLGTIDPLEKAKVQIEYKGDLQTKYVVAHVMDQDETEFIPAEYVIKDGKGYIEFEITSCSPYIVMAKSIDLNSDSFTAPLSVDSEAPTIEVSNNIATISDKNLAKITIDGEEIAVTDDEMQIDLTSYGNGEHKIVATDKFGKETSETVQVTIEEKPTVTPTPTTKPETTEKPTVTPEQTQNAKSGAVVWIILGVLAVGGVAFFVLKKKKQIDNN